MTEPKPCPFCGENTEIDFDYVEVSCPQELQTVTVTVEMRLLNSHLSEDALRNRIAELEGKLSALENDIPLQKAVERIAELEKQLQKSQIRERQLYAVLEGAKRIASEYYAFGLEGFEGEYTQIVNQLKDEPPEVEG